ncbi:MAG TPA: hypothetical protein VG710_06265 [Opitutus sp.]|nr:hypothetical protein [Opitutus sp.]
MKASRASLAAIFRVIGPLIALMLVPCSPAQDAAPAPRVVRLEGGFGVGYIVRVDIENLATWVAAGHDATKLVPYINGRGLQGNYPIEVHTAANEVHFELSITPKSREAWIDVLGPLDSTHRPVEFSVGPENGVPFDSALRDKNSPDLTIVQQPYGWISLVLVLGTLVALVVLARRTDILRDSGPMVGGAGPRRPYNLGRVQMAFWFFLTFASYVTIWLLTDAIDTITPSLLGLIGISAGTALSEVLIDSNKDSAAVASYQAAAAEKAALEQTLADEQAQLVLLAAKPAATADDAAVRDNLNRQILDQRTRLNQLGLKLKTLAPAVGANVSQGFLRDVLADGNGYSFHRFQIFVWTITLGGVFISDVYNNLAMPEFSATMLGLMGMSSGTYVGFKFPERR